MAPSRLVNAAVSAPRFIAVILESPADVANTLSHLADFSDALQSSSEPTTVAVVGPKGAVTTYVQQAVVDFDDEYLGSSIRFECLVAVDATPYAALVQQSAERAAHLKCGSVLIFPACTRLVYNRVSAALLVDSLFAATPGADGIVHAEPTTTYDRHFATNKKATVMALGSEHLEGVPAGGVTSTHGARPSRSSSSAGTSSIGKAPLFSRRSSRLLLFGAAPQQQYGWFDEAASAAALRGTQPSHTTPSHISQAVLSHMHSFETAPKRSPSSDRLALGSVKSSQLVSIPTWFEGAGPAGHRAYSSLIDIKTLIPV